jgi:uncharacterized membrane protein YuzA (DUF378 family)
MAEPPAETDYSPTALPSTGARVLAFVSILVGGLCGGLIGWSLVDLQCEGDCGVAAGLAGLAGAVIGAAGVAVVATLALRAMGEWRTIQHREQGGGPGPGPSGRPGHSNGAG